MIILREVDLSQPIPEAAGGLTPATFADLDYHDRMRKRAAEAVQQLRRILTRPGLPIVAREAVSRAAVAYDDALTEATRRGAIWKVDAFMRRGREQAKQAVGAIRRYGGGDGRVTSTTLGALPAGFWPLPGISPPTKRTGRKLSDAKTLRDAYNYIYEKATEADAVPAARQLVPAYQAILRDLERERVEQKWPISQALAHVSSWPLAAAKLRQTFNMLAEARGDVAPSGVPPSASAAAKPAKSARPKTPAAPPDASAAAPTPEAPVSGFPWGKALAIAAGVLIALGLLIGKAPTD